MLRHVSPEGPGWLRRRRGRGFQYLDERGEPLPDVERDRIRALAIPPAWQDVWICPDPRGHLQVTGTDEAGRRQYLYHPSWRLSRDAEKFARTEGFGRALGRARTLVSRHLAEESPSVERACATAFRLLDLGCFRVGNDVYADRYGSFGVTTLEKQHVHRCGTILRFDFTGKSGIEHHVEVEDRAVVQALDPMRRRRSGGSVLLAFRDAGGWQPLGSERVNDYLARVTGLPITAKDFRTWHATVLAAAVLAVAREEDELTPRQQVRDAMIEAAALLGNNAAQARKSYVDPRVVELHGRGITVASATARRALEDVSRRRPLERQVLALLREHG